MAESNLNRWQEGLRASVMRAATAGTNVSPAVFDLAPTEGFFSEAVGGVATLGGLMGHRYDEEGRQIEKKTFLGKALAPVGDYFQRVGALLQQPDFGNPESLKLEMLKNQVFKGRLENETAINDLQREQADGVLFGQVQERLRNAKDFDEQWGVLQEGAKLGSSRVYGKAFDDLVTSVKGAQETRQKLDSQSLTFQLRKDAPSRMFGNRVAQLDSMLQGSGGAWTQEVADFYRQSEEEFLKAKERPGWKITTGPTGEVTVEQGGQGGMTAVAKTAVEVNEAQSVIDAGKRALLAGAEGGRTGFVATGVHWLRWFGQQAAEATGSGTQVQDPKQITFEQDVARVRTSMLKLMRPDSQMSKNEMNEIVKALPDAGMDVTTQEFKTRMAGAIRMLEGQVRNKLSATGKPLTLEETVKRSAATYRKRVAEAADQSGEVDAIVAELNMLESEGAISAGEVQAIWRELSNGR